ncbi:MAG TPA: ABC transporter substrate-binding protein, partial [Candidatus Binatia bacterium]
QTHDLIEAIREGWNEYLRAPEKTNSLMVKLNPAMDADTMKEAADVQKPYIVSSEGSTKELGKMAAERWTTLSNQLFDLKLIEKKPQAEKLFQSF